MFAVLLGMVGEEMGAVGPPFEAPGMTSASSFLATRKAWHAVAPTQAVVPLKGFLNPDGRLLVLSPAADHAAVGVERKKERKKKIHPEAWD